MRRREVSHMSLSHPRILLESPRPLLPVRRLYDKGDDRHRERDTENDEENDKYLRERAQSLNSFFKRPNRRGSVAGELLVAAILRLP
jgi:hypothetical protein